MELQFESIIAQTLTLSIRTHTHSGKPHTCSFRLDLVHQHQDLMKEIASKNWIKTFGSVCCVLLNFKVIQDKMATNRLTN